MVGIVGWGLQQIGDLGCPLGVRPAPALDALKGGPGIVCVCNQVSSCHYDSNCSSLGVGLRMEDIDGRTLEFRSVNVLINNFF
jgi:hypothetical protein